MQQIEQISKPKQEEPNNGNFVGACTYVADQCDDVSGSCRMPMTDECMTNDDEKNYSCPRVNFLLGGQPVAGQLRNTGTIFW